MWTRQPLHGVVVVATFAVAALLHPGASQWFWLTLVVATLHHAWVAVWWRAELYGKHVSSRFGHPTGFLIFAVGFVVLAFFRVATVFWLARQEPGGLGLSEPLRWSLTGVSGLLCVALMVSVKLTFGMKRAFGLDHWEPEKHRGLGVVERGLHRVTPNAMYVFAPTVLLVAVFWRNSSVGLFAALLNWGLLWVHYLCTEKPDLATIYGASDG